MPDKVFLDTSVLVYAILNDEIRGSIAEELLAAGGHISVQVLNELAAVSRRKIKLSWAEIAEVTANIRALCNPPLPLTAETHDKAVEVANRYSYNIYDSLIIASALEAGCDLLYSEDMQDGQRIASLRIRNPFRAVKRR
jgi:predicted nucleic acid-binding protein